jgi:hypothetical protein
MKVPMIIPWVTVKLWELHASSADLVSKCSQGIYSVASSVGTGSFIPMDAITTSTTAKNMVTKISAMPGIKRSIFFLVIARRIMPVLEGRDGNDKNMIPAIQTGHDSLKTCQNSLKTLIERILRSMDTSPVSMRQPATKTGASSRRFLAKLPTLYEPFGTSFWPVQRCGRPEEYARSVHSSRSSS